MRLMPSARNRARASLAVPRGVSIRPIAPRSRPDNSDPAGGESPAVAEEDHAAEGIVELTDEQVKASQLDIVTAEVSSLGAEIIAQGSVATSPQGQALLSAGAEGRVTRIQKRLGDPVRRGETVATIESREAAAISADVTSAQARAELARTRLAREQKLYDEQVTARAELETVRAEYQQALAEVSRARQAATAASASGRYISVRSPIAGRVTGAPVVLGSYVTAQDELYRIANANSVQIEAAVPAEDARRIAAGAAARVEAPGGEITARVLSVTPTADVENRSATVVLAPASGAGLLPGEYVRVRIESRVSEGFKVLGKIGFWQICCDFRNSAIGVTGWAPPTASMCQGGGVDDHLTRQG